MAATHFASANTVSNEIIKAVDFDFAHEQSMNNAALGIQAVMTDGSKDFIVGGKVKPFPSGGMNCIIAPIYGHNADSGVDFIEILTTAQPISLEDASPSHDRIDTVQVRGRVVPYDYQDRKFRDPATGIETIENIPTKKRIAMEAVVKKGSDGSVTAPPADTGFIKLAEIAVPAASVNIIPENIKNITARSAGEENVNWTMEKTRTFNSGYVSDIVAMLLANHNEDGSHKDTIIRAANILFGNQSGAVRGSIIPTGESMKMLETDFNALTSITQVLAALGLGIDKAFPYANNLLSRYSLLDVNPAAVSTNHINIAVGGETIIDGIPCTAGQMVFLKDQENPVENGFYRVQTGAWHRFPGYTSENAGVFRHKLILAKSGNANAGSMFYLENEDYSIGVTPLNFKRSMFSPAAVPGTAVMRDSAGRAKFAAPSAGDDAARKAEVDAEAAVRANADTQLANAKQNNLNRTVIGNDNATASVTDTGGNLSISTPVTITAPAASATQATAGTKTLRSLAQTIVNNIASLFSTKQNNLNRTVTGNDNATGTVSDTGGALSIPIPVTVAAPSASAAQNTAGTKTLRSAFQTIVNNIADIFRRINGGYTSFSAPAVASFMTTDAENGKGIRIRLPCKIDSHAVVSFTVNMYNNYVQYSIKISGYMYASNNQPWFIPQAALLNTTQTGNIVVSFGYDSDNYALIHIQAANHRAQVLISDVQLGYRSMNIYEGWEITNTNDDKGTVVSTQTLVNNIADYLSHKSAASAHDATSAATASRIMMRDSAGRSQVAAPSADADIARLLDVRNEATTRLQGDNALNERIDGIVPIKKRWCTMIYIEFNTNPKKSMTIGPIFTATKPSITTFTELTSFLFSSGHVLPNSAAPATGELPGYSININRCFCSNASSTTIFCYLNLASTTGAPLQSSFHNGSIANINSYSTNLGA